MPEPTTPQATPSLQTPAAAATPATLANPPASAQPAAAPAPAKPAASGSPAPQAGGDGKVPLAALMEERDRRQSLQAELETLRGELSQIKQSVGGFQQQPQVAQQNNVKEHLDKLWETDPRQAVQAEIMLAAQWMDNVAAQVEHEASSLASKYADFNDFRNTAMGYVRSLPLEQRSRPGVVEMAYLVARGQNVDRIIEAQRQQLAQQFQQNPSMFQVPPGAGAPAVGGQQKQALSDDQMRAASAMGIAPEEYLKFVRQ